MPDQMYSDQTTVFNSRERGLDLRREQWFSRHSHVQICLGAPSHPMDIRALSWNIAEMFDADYYFQLMQRMRQIPPTPLLTSFSSAA